MCTVTFTTGSNAVFIGGNRDEQKSRPDGKPPEIHQVNGMKYLAPTDSKAGGTWIAVNKSGLTLCLLNRYQGNAEQQFESGEPPSRGVIIPRFIHHQNLEKLANDIELNLHVEQFRPFTLIALSSNPVSAIRWDWNGETFIKSDKKYAPVLWVSSGYDQEDVEIVRQNVFKTFLDDAGNMTLESMKKLHSSKIPEQGAYSIAMMLDHVQTVSSTIVEIHDKAVLMHYHHGYPTKNGTWKTFELSRD